MAQTGLLDAGMRYELVACMPSSRSTLQRSQVFVAASSRRFVMPTVNVRNASASPDHPRLLDSATTRFFTDLDPGVTSTSRPAWVTMIIGIGTRESIFSFGVRGPRGDHRPSRQALLRRPADQLNEGRSR